MIGISYSVINTHSVPSFSLPIYAYDTAVNFCHLSSEMAYAGIKKFLKPHFNFDLGLSQLLFLMFIFPAGRFNISLYLFSLVISTMSSTKFLSPSLLLSNCLSYGSMALTPFILLSVCLLYCSIAAFLNKIIKIKAKITFCEIRFKSY